MTDWQAVAAIGQLVTTALAVPSAIFLGLQVGQAGRSADLSSLLTFHKDIAQSEDLLSRTDQSDERWSSVLEDHMNLLEIYTAAVNHNLLGRASRKMATHKLIDSCALLDGNEDARAKLAATGTSPYIFAELRTFAEQNRYGISRSKCHFNHARGP